MRKLLPPAVALALLLASAPLSAGVCVSTHGSWTTRAPFPVNMVRAWGAYSPTQGKFYVLGGRQTDTAGSDLLNPRIFDPASGLWSLSAAAFGDNQVNNMVGGVLTFGATEYIVVVGGSAAGATTATSAVRRYDPALDQLTTLATDPWPGSPSGDILPGGAAVHGNKLYVFGGFQINVGMVNTIWEFDPARADGARWVQKAAVLPQALGYLPTATSGDNIYTFGGSAWVGGTLEDSAVSYQYDPVLDTIGPVTATPRASAETRAVAQVDGTIWVLSGGRTAPNPTTQVDVYDPVGDAWSLGPPLLTARRNFAADSDPATGRIWAAGGYDTSGTTPLAVNEEFSGCVIFVDGFESSDTSAWTSTVP